MNRSDCQLKPIIALMVVPPCAFSPVCVGSPLLQENACVALRSPLLRLLYGQLRNCRHTYRESRVTHPF
jgi:hypothetical protein